MPDPEKSPNSRFEETDEIELLRWKSLERNQPKRSREFYSTMLVLAILVSIIMFFIEGIMPVLVIWAIIFFLWASAKTPPQEIDHALTSWGIRTGTSLYRYSKMNFYWFEDASGDKGLLRVSLNGLPGQLSLIINENQIDDIRAIMEQAGVPFLKPKPGAVGNLVNWFSNKISLE